MPGPSVISATHRLSEAASHSQSRGLCSPGLCSSPSETLPCPWPGTLLGGRHGPPWVSAEVLGGFGGWLGSGCVPENVAQI